MARRLLYLVPDAGYFLGHRLALATAAREAGWEVEVATAADPRQQQIEALGFGVHSLPFRRHSRNPFAAFFCLLAILRLYRALRPALVHTVTLKAVVLGGLAGRLAGVPAMVHAVTGLGYLFTAPSLDWRLLRWPVKLAVHLATPARARLLAEHEGDLALLSWSSSLRSRGRVVPGSGVDPDVFAEAAMPAGTPRFLLASRLLRSKGVETFVVAARMLKQRNPEIECLLAGEPDEGHPDSLSRAEIEAWVDEGVVTWLGQQADMPELLASVQVVVLPSAYGEGIPRCLLEGASVGRALVASDLPGCREIVRDGENGFTVGCRDVEGLAAALEKLAREPELRASFGRAGRRLVLARFSDAKIVAATLRIYDEIAVKP